MNRRFEPYERHSYSSAKKAAVVAAPVREKKIVGFYCNKCKQYLGNVTVATCDLCGSMKVELVYD